MKNNIIWFLTCVVFVCITCAVCFHFFIGNKEQVEPAASEEETIPEYVNPVVEEMTDEEHDVAMGEALDGTTDDIIGKRFWDFSAESQREPYHYDPFVTSEVDSSSGIYLIGMADSFTYEIVCNILTQYCKENNIDVNSFVCDSDWDGEDAVGDFIATVYNDDVSLGIAYFFYDDNYAGYIKTETPRN